MNIFIVDGGFSDWSDYGRCSKTCGGGSQVSSRTCTNPAPAHGGKACVGPLQKSRSCNTNPCPGMCLFLSMKNGWVYVFYFAYSLFTKTKNVDNVLTNLQNIITTSFSAKINMLAC